MSKPVDQEKYFAEVGRALDGNKDVAVEDYEKFYDFKIYAADDNCVVEDPTHQKLAGYQNTCLSSRGLSDRIPGCQTRGDRQPDSVWAWSN